MASHNPRCAIFRDPPSLRDANDCNCGAIPPLPDGRVDVRANRLRVAATEGAAALQRHGIHDAADDLFAAIREFEKAAR